MSDDRRSNLSRRDIVAMSLVAGVAAATGEVSAADLPLTDSTVAVKTPDGTCDAAFIHPTTGSYPAVVIWPDAFGLRGVMRDIGKRIAAEGYAVLVPNPFYRAAKAPYPGLEDPAKFDFSNPADLAKLRPLMNSFTAPGAIESDAAACIAFLDAQRQVNTSKKIGTHGYCMGGPFVFKTAAAVPNRVGAAATLHGGGLVTDAPTSPHLLAPKIKARVYLAIAGSDDARQPDAKDKLRAAFAAASVPAEIEVYTTSKHGWCVPDNVADASGPIYNRSEAERAWAKLVALYKAALA